MIKKTIDYAIFFISKQHKGKNDGDADENKKGGNKKTPNKWIQLQLISLND